MASFNVTVDDSSNLLSYSPVDAWTDTANGTAPASSYQASSYHTTQVQGASVSFSFTGTGIWFFGAKLPAYGGYKLAIDGQTVTSGSATSNAPQFNVLLGGAGGLSNGKHTAVLSTTDGSGIDVDQVMFEAQIGTSSSKVTTTIVDDSDPAIKYTGQWTPTTDPRFKDNTLHFSSDGGAKATYTFTGEAIGAYGTTSTDHGDLKLTIDGNAVTVDPYAGVRTLHLQNLLYFASGLTPGQHTIEFEGNPGLTGNTATFADLDYFQVYSADPPANNGNNNGAAVGSSGANAVSSPSATAAASESQSTAGFTTNVLPAKASSKSNIGPIVGGVIGGIIILALLAFTFFFLWRRRRNNGSSSGSSKRRTFMTPATPALPLQFGPDSSPIDTEKGPTMLVPTFASAPAPLGYNANRMDDYYNRGPTMGNDLSRTSTGDSQAPLIMGAPLPRKPSATAPRTMPSRAPGNISRAGTPEMKQMPSGAPPDAPSQAQRAIRPMASNRSLNGAPFRPSRPPSLQLTAVDIAAPIPQSKSQAPMRPARPDNPHLSVLHDRRAAPSVDAAANLYALPTRPSRPSSPHLSDVDQPVPVPASRKPVRPARPERESFGTVVDLYSRR